MSFTFNSVVFANLGVTVLDGWEVTGATTRPLKAVGLPGASRVWYASGDSSACVVEFPVRIQAATAAALITALDAINAALTTTADAALSYYYTDRAWLARWDGVALRCPVLNTTTLQTRIRFLAQPNMLATSATTGSVSITGTPQTVYIPGPNLSSGLVAGNAVTAPVLTLRNTSSAIASSGLIILNATTGDYITYLDTVPNNRYVRFNCDLRKAYTSPDGTTWTEVLGKVASDWLTIQGGVAATLSVVGCGGGTLSWSYTGRFL